MIMNWVQRRVLDSGFEIIHFQMMGAVCFAVITLMSIINLLDNAIFMQWYSIVSALGYILFQGFLTYLFFWMWMGSREIKQTVKSEKSDEDLIKLAEEFK